MKSLEDEFEPFGHLGCRLVFDGARRKDVDSRISGTENTVPRQERSGINAEDDHAGSMTAS